MCGKSAKNRITLQDVQGLPHEKGLSLQYVRGHTYVVKRSYKYDKALKKSIETRKTLGQVVNNVFFTQEEYKKQFKRGMSPRNEPRAHEPRANDFMSPEEEQRFLETLEHMSKSEIENLWKLCKVRLGLDD